MAKGMEAVAADPAAEHQAPPYLSATRAGLPLPLGCSWAGPNAIEREAQLGD